MTELKINECLRNLVHVKHHLLSEGSESPDHLTSQITTQITQEDTLVDPQTKIKQAFTNCAIITGRIELHSSCLSTPAPSETALVSIII